jgi:hypothetical protein
MILTYFFLRAARLAISLIDFGFGGFLPFRIWVVLRGLGMIISVS